MELVGKNLNEVMEWLNRMDKRYRITSRDGNAYVITCDYRPERYNLDIVDGKVVKISMG